MEQNLIPEVNAGAQAKEMGKREHGNEIEKFKATLQMLLKRLQDLKAQIEHATQDREEKSEVEAKQFQAKADAEGEREDTTTTRDVNM